MSTLRRIIHTIGMTLLAGIVLTVMAPTAEAAGAGFSLYPSTGYAVLSKNFAVDIMLNTGSQDTTQAKAVFRFDPTRVRVVKAEYGDLYCQYPETDYTVDNVLGWVKMTGFCLDPYYNSDSTSELFGRITFVPLIEGTITFTFVTDYGEEEWETSIMNAGSPPQTVTGIILGGGTYTAVSSIDDGDHGPLPGVGIFDDRRILIGLGLVGCGVAVFAGDRILGKIRRASSSDGTVII